MEWAENKYLHFIFWIIIFLCLENCSCNVRSEKVKIMQIKGFTAKYENPDGLKKLRKYTEQLAANNPDLLYINGQTNEPNIALTFDDAPSRHCPDILKILKEENIRAVFFCIGRNVERFPEIVEKIEQEGHLVLNHTYDHKKITLIEETELDSQLIRTESAIYNLIGKKPALFRMPYGRINQKTLNRLAQNNYKTISWSLDSFDWLVDEHEAVSIVLNNIRNDDIILFHCRATTSKALPKIINKLKQQSFRFVRLDSLLKINAYKNELLR